MDLLIQYAMQFVGVPYKWNGKNPMDGFDCSGLIQELLTSMGIYFMGPQSAQMLYKAIASSASTRQLSLAQAGALIFYGGGPDQIHHVAMMIDNYRMIEAGGGGPNVIDKTTASQSNAFVKIRPYTFVPGVFAILLPAYRQ